MPIPVLYNDNKIIILKFLIVLQKSVLETFDGKYVHVTRNLCLTKSPESSVSYSKSPAHSQHLANTKCVN